MRSLSHTLNVYQRPVQGNKFVGRYEAFDYTHRILAVGGFDTAQCSLRLDAADAEDFMLNNLGCRVSVIVDNPAEPCWEGFINRISVNAGSLAYSIGLDEMVNQTFITWTENNTTSIVRSTTVANTDSQARYGIKEGSIEGYILEGGLTQRLQNVRSRYLAQRAWPSPTEAYNATGDYTIQIEMLGFYHTINWVAYVITDSVARTVSDSLIAAWANYPVTNRVFVSATDTSAIVSNSAFSMSNIRELSGLTFWQYLQSIQEAGDGDAEWIIGVTQTPYNSTTRRLYYRPASTEVKYTLKRSEGIVRDKLGKKVRPWVVKPDGIAKATDVFQGYTSQFPNDPREFYVQSVTYSANDQTVKLESDDSLSPTGVFKLRKHFKLRGQNFGARLRTIR